MLTFIDENTDLDALFAPYKSQEDTIESIYSIETKTGFTSSEVEIKKESEKAFFVEMFFFKSRAGRVVKTHSYYAETWIPKSKVEIVTDKDGFTAAILPNWLYNAKLKETGCTV